MGRSQWRGQEGILSVGIDMFVETNEAGDTERLNSEEMRLPVEVPSLHDLSPSCALQQSVLYPLPWGMAAGSSHPCRGLLTHTGIGLSLSACRHWLASLPVKISVVSPEKL